jgi:hypothetical protein
MEAASAAVCVALSEKSVVPIDPDCPIVIAAGGQVVNVVGRAFTPEMLAVTWVLPGLLAVTSPLPSTVPTLVSKRVIVAGPTLILMSAPPLSKAAAVNCWV